MDGEEATPVRGPEPELKPPMPVLDMPILEPGRRSIRSGWGRAIQSKKVLLAAGGTALLASAVGAGLMLSGDDGTRAEVTDQEQDPQLETNPGNGSAAGAAAETAETQADPSELARAGVVPGDEATTPLSGASAASQDVTVPFGQARGFRQALLAAGCSREEYTALEGALEDVMDFRRCRPEDHMVFARNASGTLTRFEFHGRDATAYYRARRNAQGAFEGERVQRPTETRTVRSGATIQSSLAEAVQRMGLERTLVPMIASAFDSKADFGSDTRSGDVIRVIVDREYLDGDFLRFGAVQAIRYEGQKTGLLEAYWYVERRGEEGEFWDASGHAMQGGWLRTPCRFDRISSPFDPRRMHPILRRIVPHNGVDYAAGTGTPVWAAADGTISFAGFKGANGNLVSIRHEGGFESHYAHLNRIARGIRNGTKVEQRQLIGYIGTTGRSTGPHLHFGLKHNGRFVDPMDHLNGPGRRMRSGVLPRFRRHVAALQRELGAISLLRGRSR